MSYFDEGAKIATGEDAVAIWLTQHVKFYQPKIWVVPIHNVAFSPYFMADDVIAMRKDFDSFVKSKKYPWYVIEAIKDYFKKEGVSK